MRYLWFVLFFSSSLCAQSKFLPVLPPQPGFPVMGKINLDPILARHDVGNALALAFNPEDQVFYVGHGSDYRGSWLYTVNLQGQLLAELNLDGWLPLSFSYESSTRHLFAEEILIRTTDVISRYIEMQPDGQIVRTILNQPIINESLITTDDGIWGVNGQDELKHFDRDGKLLEQFSIEASFPGPASAAWNLSESLNGGFYFTDEARNVIETDRQGRELRRITTKGIQPGFRPWRILQDSTHLFLEMTGWTIYSLSPDFLKIREFQAQASVPNVVFDRTPQTGAPGGTWEITSAFQLTESICEPFFEVTQLTSNHILGFVKEGSQQTQDKDGLVIVHPSMRIEANQAQPFTFRINLQNRQWFYFFVRLWGLPC